jgi:hypothetical protein
MFDQILDLVKQQLGNNPQVASAIPAGQQEVVHQEVATQITNSLANHASQTGVGGLLSSLQNGLSSGSGICTQSKRPK